MDFFKKNKEMGYLVIGLSIMIIAAFIHFLVNADGGLSGWQILKREGAAFWIGILLAGVVAGGLTKFAMLRYRKTQEGMSVIPIIVAIFIVIAIAFGKGCTDKANGGVTTEKGR